MVRDEGNQNNEVGLPLTLGRLEPDTEVCIVELGMRGIGQSAELCAVAQPDVGVITKIAVDPGPGTHATAQLDMLGEIKEDRSTYFQRGVTDYPMIGDTVDVISPRELRLIFDISGPATIAIGITAWRRPPRIRFGCSAR